MSLEETRLVPGAPLAGAAGLYPTGAQDGAGGPMARLFRLQEKGTTVRTEVIAGLTTFLTMAYIMFVNPDILSTTGMDRDAVFVATGAHRSRP